MAYIIQPRNRLIYPGGNSGFDPSHPAAKGVRFAGVATGNSFLSITDPRTATAHNTISFRQTPIGPTLWTDDSHTGNITVPVPVDTTVSAINFASIAYLSGAVRGTYAKFIGVDTPEQGILIHNGIFNPVVNGTSYYPSYTFGAGIYFVAMSAFSGVLNWVVCNMTTGAIITGSQSAASPGSSTGGYVNLGGTLNYGASYLGGGLATAFYGVNTPLSVGDLQRWASDPWALWYPQYTRNTIYKLLSGASVTAAATINEGADTLNASAMLTVTGALSTTEANDTFSGLAVPYISATLAATEANDILSGQAVPYILASLSTTEAPDTLSAIAGLIVNGNINVTEANDTLNANVTRSITEAPETLSAQAYIYNTPSSTISTGAVHTAGLEWQYWDRILDNGGIQ